MGRFNLRQRPWDGSPWADLDFRAEALWVEQQVQGKLMVSQPMARASSRRILLPAPVLELLE